MFFSLLPPPFSPPSPLLPPPSSSPSCLQILATTATRTVYLGLGGCHCDLPLRAMSVTGYHPLDGTDQWEARDLAGSQTHSTSWNCLAG